MKRILTLFLCLCLTLTFPAALAAPTGKPDTFANGEYVLDEIIIKFVDPSAVPGQEKQLQQEIEKVEKIGFVEALGVYVVKAGDLSKNPQAVLNRFKNNKYIEYVEPNYLARFEYIPNDPYYQPTYSNWINAPAGWDITKGVGSPIVAVIDSGVAPQPDLPPLLPGYSAVAGLSPNSDTVGHGTRVAGVVGAIGDNRIGVVGINWNAKILPVKVDDASGSLTIANIAKGITWASDNGAKVINLSVSTASDSITLKNAIDYAYNKGCAIFSSTSNDGKNGINYPARYPNVIAVGSTSNGSSRHTTSNYGVGMGVVASASYYTTTQTGGYALVSGTSVASPQVASLASLILAVNPALTNAEVYALIQQGAKTLGGGYNIETGYGLLDCGKTLAMALATVPVIEDPPPVYASPPIITLKGQAAISLEEGTAYTEPGWTATDCLGADLTAAVTVVGGVNTAVPGVYTLTYGVTDAGGNTASVARTVTVTAKIIVIPPATPPTIALVGANPIILHLGGSAYVEQGATALDAKDATLPVQIIGTPDTSKAGTYTVTYRAVNSAGLEAVAVRQVRVLAPIVKTLPRVAYNFTGQGKVPTTVTHTGVVAEAAGYMDLNITNLSGKMSITVKVVNAATGSAVSTDTFSAEGGRKVYVDAGRYNVVVTIDSGNGNCNYKMSLLAPEVVTYTFELPETPQGLPMAA